MDSFAERGIDGARHADIAASAGVAVPTVFTYFPTREALVSDVLDHVGEFLLDHVLVPTAKVSDRDEAVRLSGVLMERLAENHSAYAKVWLMWSTHFGESLRSRYEIFEDRLIGQVEKLLAPRFHADDDTLADRARIMIAAAGMLVQLSLRGEDSKRRRSFIRHVSELVANA